MFNKINFFFVTLFGIGKIKKIPGSFASLATALFLFFLFHILNVSPNMVLFSIIIIFFISLYAVSIFIKNLPNKEIHFLHNICDIYVSMNHLGNLSKSIPSTISISLGLYSFNI